jgi:hypothetical protein
LSQVNIKLRTTHGYQGPLKKGATGSFEGRYNDQAYRCSLQHLLDLLRSTDFEIFLAESKKILDATKHSLLPVVAEGDKRVANKEVEEEDLFGSHPTDEDLRAI